MVAVEPGVLGKDRSPLKPYLADPDVTLYQGDAREVLRSLDAGSVDCVVTSPPYLGLRDYGIEPTVWGGDPEHVHDWGGELRPSHPGQVPQTLGGSAAAAAGGNAGAGHLCACGAWLGVLGLEPSIALYTAHLVELFREIRRVLADAGTVWLNIGDSYNAYNGGAGPGSELSKTQTEARPRLSSGFGLQQKELKPKDLMMVPARAAIALQDDGWYLRAAITWCKPNPMPESVRDRPTKATEMVFLLSKSQRYYFGQEDLREPHGGRSSGNRERFVAGGGERGRLNTHLGSSIPWTPASTPDPNVLTLSPDLPPEAPRGADGRRRTTRVEHSDERMSHPNHADSYGGERWPGDGRNIRDWWEIAVEPFPEAHFATFPTELARRCILGGCPEQVCRECGKARERLVEVESRPNQSDNRGKHDGTLYRTVSGGVSNDRRAKHDVGFSDCGHDAYRPGIVLDPFIGSGTTAHVARKLGRHAVGIDLNADYLAMAARRLSQQSLFAEAVGS